MFEAGLFGTLEDLGYGARNAVSGLFTRSYTGGSDDNSDELSPEINVADIRKYYGDLMATVAKESIRTKAETLVAALSDEKSRLSKAIEYAAKTTSAPENIVKEVVMDVFTEDLENDEKIKFTKIFAELNVKDMTAVPGEDDTEESLDLTMGGKLKMSDKLVELISKIYAGEVEKDDIVKQLEKVDTNITFNIVDFIKDAITTAAKTEDDEDDDKTPPTASTEKTMDLKSLLMETEIGQKLFEHV